MNFIEFILGAVLIFYGSNLLIDNSKIIAKVFNVSPLIIGLTIIAFGTSLPELVVSVVASFEEQGGGEIILGNVLGSNIANIALVLSVIAIFKTIRINILKIKLSLFFLVISTISALIIIYLDQLTYVSGILLLVILFLFMYSQFKDMIPERKKLDPNCNNNNFHYKYIFYLIIGIAMLGMGSKFFIDGAIGIAEQLELNVIVISLSIVAFGTSLPELITSVIAIRKNEPSFVIGNIIGSNIINILLVMGSCVIISPISLSELNIEWPIIFLIITTLVFTLLILFSKSINKIHGFSLLGIYLLFIYINFVIMNPNNIEDNVVQNRFIILYEKF